MRKLGQIAGDHAAPVVRFEAFCTAPCLEDEPRHRASVRNLELGRRKGHHCEAEAERKYLRPEPTFWFAITDRLEDQHRVRASALQANVALWLAATEEILDASFVVQKLLCELQEEYRLPTGESICHTPHMGLTSNAWKEPHAQDVERAHPCT